MLIIFSTPENFDNEISILIQLFEQGLETFHLRKPDFQKEEIEAYILQIPLPYRNRIVLHQHHELATQYALKGVHFPEYHRNTPPIAIGVRLYQEIEAYKKTGMTISTSVHAVEDIKALDGLFDYITVSPVFDSISKKGYKANPDLDVRHLKGKLTTKLIALGGVKAENVEAALDKGFDGVAVLGYVWGNLNKVVERFTDYLKK